MSATIPAGAEPASSSEPLNAARASINPIDEGLARALAGGEPGEHDDPEDGQEGIDPIY